jgi:hypothetical protein
MSDQEEFIPGWLDEKTKLVPGTYIWPVLINTASFRDLEREKPYVKLDAMVTDGPFADFKFEFRIYLTKAARGWATFFFKKFGYPQELLDDPVQPRIRKQAIEGLAGKVLVEVHETEYGLNIDPKGFERTEETELEDKLKPKDEVVLEPKEPSIDLEADVKAQPAEDLSWLDFTEEKK